MYHFLILGVLATCVHVVRVAGMCVEVQGLSIQFNRNSCAVLSALWENKAYTISSYD